MDIVADVVKVFAVVLVYFVPTLVADYRKHKSKSAIIAVNLLLGWTIVGWLWAFIWALSGESRRNLEK
jgi:threonine/homoserine/homoserine lactone efflux protein